MSALALDYSYRYLQPSQLAPARRDSSTHALQLATFSDNDEKHPYFFTGQLANPKRTAQMLRGLMQIVRARFHVPAAMLERILILADPVVTCSDALLRFEGFSSCCGEYVRVDLLPDALHGETFGRGTTNVDFNEPMLAALATVRDTDDVSISVGSDRVALSKNSETVIEKQVKLPFRWLKGLVEVQACQARMQLVHEVAGLQARRFFKSLPRMNTSRRETFIVAAGKGLRLSQVASSQAVRVGGLQRLRVLEGLASQARSLRIYSDATSAIHAQLKWQAVIDIEQLAKRVDYPLDVIRGALTVLGARGLVGYDLGEAAYFHRELPFDLSQVEKLQPRLKNAKKLIAENKVRVGSQSAMETEVFVTGSGVEHRVLLTADTAKCTCPWYAKHGSTRGPCKHILAARTLLEEDEVWKLFEYEGAGENSLANYDRFSRNQKWHDAPLSCVQSGDLPRERLLIRSLDALARDFNHYRAKWFATLHDALQPTADEQRGFAERYLQLLGNSAPNIVTWAFKKAEALSKKNVLEARQLINGLRPVLEARSKGIVEKALQQINKAGKENADTAEEGHGTVLRCWPGG